MNMNTHPGIGIISNFFGRTRTNNIKFHIWFLFSDDWVYLPEKP